MNYYIELQPPANGPVLFSGKYLRHPREGLIYLMVSRKGAEGTEKKDLCDG